jgi:hypothetical protein
VAWAGSISGSPFFFDQAARQEAKETPAMRQAIDFIEEIGCFHASKGQNEFLENGNP